MQTEFDVATRSSYPQINYKRINLGLTNDIKDLFRWLLTHVAPIPHFWQHIKEERKTNHGVNIKGGLQVVEKHCKLVATENEVNETHSVDILIQPGNKSTGEGGSTPHMHMLLGHRDEETGMWLNSL